MYPALDANFLDVLKHHTAGDPMNQQVRWTNLTLEQISLRLSDRRTPAGVHVVQRLLKRHGFVRRKAQKKRTMGQHADRNAQFENIARLKQEYLDAGQPVVSVDTKKKERLGNFYRDGRLYTRQTIETWDHDFGSAGSGVVIPHGIYDVARNCGHINLGTSHDTSEFACASIARWWREVGRRQHRRATTLLVLCDGGGSNSATHYIFKEDLQRLANTLGLEIRVAHYPPYCSKYNPIEHRFFPHVTRACQGLLLTSTEVTCQAMARTSTKQGLKTSVQVLPGDYPLKEGYPDEYPKTMKIRFDEEFPTWNYRAIPGKCDSY